MPSTVIEPGPTWPGHQLQPQEDICLGTYCCWACFTHSLQAIPFWPGCGVLCVQGTPGLLAAAAWGGLGRLGHTHLASPAFQHDLCLGETPPVSTLTCFTFPALQLLLPF